MLSWLPRDLGRWAGIIAAVALTAGALIASVTDGPRNQNSNADTPAVDVSYKQSATPEVS